MRRSNIKRWNKKNKLNSTLSITFGSALFSNKILIIWIRDLPQAIWIGYFPVYFHRIIVFEKMKRKEDKKSQYIIFDIWISSVL